MEYHLPILLVCIGLVLIVAEGATLVFITAMAVDQDISTKRILVLWDGGSRSVLRHDPGR